MRSVKQLILGLMLVGASFSLSGCGGATMALVKGQEKIELNESVALLSVKVANDYKPGYQPELAYAYLQQLVGADKIEMLTVSIKDDPFHIEKDKFKEYLLSFNLKSGRYSLAGLLGNYSIPLLLRAQCNVPTPNAVFEIKPGKVVYLGKLNATIIERTNDKQLRAGSMIPLLDQALAGFSGGTFNVVIDDNYEADIKDYREQYPALRGMDIEKAVIGAQKPSVAQK